MNLNNKIAIVTGAAGGIGQAIAVTLASRGVKVLIADVKADADETLQLIKAVNGTAAFFRGDNRHKETHEAMFKSCVDTYGIPDFFIANAGLSRMISIEASTEQDFYELYETNVKGTFFGLQQALKVMEPGGKVIVIGSSSVPYPVPGMALYAGTKAAEGAMVDVAAIEFGKKGITVNAVLPGVTATKEALEHLPKAHLENVANTTPLGRCSSPDDIAKAVAMLCSSDSDWISGQHIVVNGGASF